MPLRARSGTLLVTEQLLSASLTCLTTQLNFRCRVYIGKCHSVRICAILILKKSSIGAKRVHKPVVVLKKAREKGSGKHKKKDESNEPETFSEIDR